MSSNLEIKSNAIIKRLSEAKSVDGLIKYLDARRHNFYHHFTTFAKLEQVLLNENFRFTQDSGKNDMHEYKDKGSPERRDKILSVSLSWGDEDNMAMWAMYGIPWEDAVRITMTGKAVKRWLKITQKYVDETEDAACAKLHDIVYYQGIIGEDPNVNWNKNNSLLLHNQRKGKIEKGIFREIMKPDKMTSYVKNSAWKQEQESRLSIFYKTNRSTFVEIPFGDDFSYFLNNTIITFGPWTSPMAIEEKRKRIRYIINEQRKAINNQDKIIIRDEKILDLKSKLIGKCLIISSSPFFNKIKLRKHCDFCNKHMSETES